MSTESPKKSSKLPMILVGCGCLLLVGVAVAGILAAIAIPAFTRYIQQSKAVEAEANLNSMAHAASSYYQRECKFPPSAAPSSKVPTSGDRIASNFKGKGWDELSSTTISNENYFAYETRRKGNSFVVTARADFDPGGPVHEATVTIKGNNRDKSNCTAEVGSIEIKNELE